MKKTVAACIFTFLIISGTLCAHPVDNTRLATTLSAQTTQGVDQYLSAPDPYGTPLIIKLARQGDVKTLLELAQYPSTGKFLLATDKYGNNLFHVAKNADRRRDERPSLEAVGGSAGKVRRRRMILLRLRIRVIF